MAKTKREYVLASCFLSGAAAIISFVALGTQEWVTSDVANDIDGNVNPNEYVKIGLFGGVFHQETGTYATFELSTVCAWDLNICAFLCGDDVEDNLRILYNNEKLPSNYDTSCAKISAADTEVRRITPRASEDNTEKIFLNTGMWFCTILFLLISGIMGVFSAGLAIWNTATNPHQVYLSIFGLYIYNAIAFFTVLLPIALWGAAFAQDLRYNIPSYKTFDQGFVTKDHAQLGYSYWINLASLFLYAVSICLLYVRNYLISKEPKVNLELEENADPVIYLY
ncbi:uncharacterized protein LOC135140151 [Zophobas morio]|uniref:uncharacterized protein LOC135140151 n=1 Tax=Zophobas morio TaxID=2755281 RepID=UPI003083CE21